MLDRVKECTGRDTLEIKATSGPMAAAGSLPPVSQTPSPPRARYAARLAASGPARQSAHRLEISRVQPARTGEPADLISLTPRLTHDVAPYRNYSGRIHSPDASQRYLVADVVSIVNAEGPIHREAVMRRIAAAWGVGRVGSRIRQTLSGIVESTVRQRVVRLSRDSQYLWPKDEVQIVPRVPDDDDERRPMDEICPEEITAAVKVCLKHAYGSVSREDLSILVVRLFGYQRVTDRLSAPVGAVIDAMLKQGEIEMRNGLVRMPR